MRSIIFNSYILVFSISAIILSGCNKHHVNKLAGDHTCSVHHSYWDMTPSNFDTIYTDTLSIIAQGDILDVLGFKIPVDSVIDEQEFITGGNHNYLKVQFINDSLYTTYS